MHIIVNLDKPAHMSSQQAVTAVKRLLGAKKAGHAGTLDPIATGVLLVCVNEATKITRFVSDLEKEYLVRLKLGEKTDTYDSTGRILATRETEHIDEEDVRKVLADCTGWVFQTPPMYSAIRIRGERLYRLARKGIVLDRPERNVFIRQIDLISFDNPFLEIKVICSKGTYMRSLCDDIGKKLGTGAHMTALTRLRIGPFGIDNAIALTDVGKSRDSVISIDEALAHFREVILDDVSSRKARQGMPVRMGAVDLPAGVGEDISGADASRIERLRYVRLKSPDGQLLGIGQIVDQMIRVERLFNDLR